MSRSIALGMLRQGNTGDEILQILDVIVADIESEKTINEIAEILFWLIVTLRGENTQNPPFSAQIYKDYAFFILKKVFLIYLRCL